MSLPDNKQRKTINILGVTGSIGQSAMDVICAHANCFDVNVISAHRDESGLAAAADRLCANKTILTSQQDLNEALQDPVDITLCAIMGMAGLESMMIAIANSKAVLIANKEPLVAAGPLVIAAAQKCGTTLLPVDSEHNAIFQVFDFERRESIKRIILTASGGPFREWSADQMAKATPEQAVAHPNWSMGAKISVDSATMMNKALEVIEAHYLFNLPPEQIDVLIHPQSIIHSMVEYNDGSLLAQMGASDMRTPLANVLAWPERLETPGQRLDLTQLSQLDFEEACHVRFPALKLAYGCLEKGLYASIAMNASNEIAVDAFLNNRIGFLDILQTVHHMIDGAPVKTLDSMAEILEFDGQIREKTDDYINTKITVSAA